MISHNEHLQLFFGPQSIKINKYADFWKYMPSNHMNLLSYLKIIIKVKNYY